MKRAQLPNGSLALATALVFVALSCSSSGAESESVPASPETVAESPDAASPNGARDGVAASEPARGMAMAGVEPDLEKPDPGATNSKPGAETDPKANTNVDPMLDKLMADAAPGSAPADGDESALDDGRLKLPDLSATQRAELEALLGTEPCACGKPHSLAVSVREHPRCRNSIRLAEAMAHLFAEGMSRADIEANSESMRAALDKRTIDVSGRPSLGNSGARVTVVVFADFQCPHCAAESPRIRTTIESRKDARLVFKHFPLSSHPAAHRAAQAAEAAFALGGDDQFWAMQARIFGAQRDLDGDVDAVLRGHAKAIGLDLGAYDAFMSADKGKPAVDADRRDGETARVMGTPTVFVNGRELHPQILGGDLNRSIDDALRR